MTETPWENLGCLQERRPTVHSPNRRLLFLQDQEKKHWRKQDGPVRRSKKGQRLSPLAAASLRMQEAKTACASELLSRWPWRADQIEER